MRIKNIAVVLILIIFAIFFGLSYTGVIKLGFLDLRSHIAFLPLLVVVAAFLDSLNPCAFSVLFLTMAFLFSLGHEHSRIVKAGLTYVFGIFLTYFFIGLGIFKALTFFNITNGVAKFGAFLVIVYAVISLINEFYPKFPIKLKIPEASHGKIGELVSKASIPASFVLGILVGLFEFPCAGWPYLFILSLVHGSSTHYVGLAYLFLYNIIFVLPLLIALFIAADKIVLEKINLIRKTGMKKVRVWIAVVFIAMGLLVFLL